MQPSDIALLSGRESYGVCVLAPDESARKVRGLQADVCIPNLNALSEPWKMIPALEVRIWELEERRSSALLGHCESLSLRSRKGMVLGRLLGRKGGGYNSRLNVPGVLYPPRGIACFTSLRFSFQLKLWLFQFT